MNRGPFAREAEEYSLPLQDSTGGSPLPSCVESARHAPPPFVQTAEANPTGGNKMRGLYNIALKSLGAAKKKHAEVRRGVGGGYDAAAAPAAAPALVLHSAAAVTAAAAPRCGLRASCGTQSAAARAAAATS